LKFSDGREDHYHTSHDDKNVNAVLREVATAIKPTRGGPTSKPTNPLARKTASIYYFALSDLEY
jgi:hypothetical protein